MQKDTWLYAQSFNTFLESGFPEFAPSSEIYVFFPYSTVCLMGSWEAFRGLEKWLRRSLSEV